MQPETQNPTKDRKFTFAIMALAASVFLCFAFAGEPERGLLAACSTGVPATVTYVKWEIRRTRYFKVVMAVAAILHAIAVYYADLPRLTAPVFTVMPIMIFDTILLLLILAQSDWSSRPRGEGNVET